MDVAITIDRVHWLNVINILMDAPVAYRIVAPLVQELNRQLTEATAPHELMPEPRRPEPGPAE